MAEYLPKFPEGGQAVTFTASAAVTGGRVVAVSGNRTVAPAAAASTTAIGVAGDDAAVGATVAVRLAGPVEKGVAAAAIAAGAHVEAAAAGKIQTRTTGTDLGIALNEATAADQTIDYVRN